MHHTTLPRLIPLTKWNQYHIWPSVAGLRHLVAHAKEKNFEDVVVKVAGRVLINEEQFFTWAKQVNGGKNG